jgi:subtilisin family serine protease
MKSQFQNLTKAFVAICIGVLFINFSLLAQTHEKYFQDGQLFVKFHDHYDPGISVGSDQIVKKKDATYFSDIFKNYKVESLSQPVVVNNDIKLHRTFLFSFKEYDVLDEVITVLEQKPEIEYAEKVPLYYINYTPNDSLYNLINGPQNWKWHLDVINAELAWDITKGSPDIKVAIVDNAIWAQHPDLEDKIVAQRDVINNTNSSNPPSTGDPGDWSHGTHVAGLATAITDNGIGVAGIGFNTSIIAVRASNNNNPIAIFGYQGVLWAVNNGANIVNMSFGGPGYSQTMQNLINSGNDMGIVFVAAAGNDNNSVVNYPAGYNHVISVASTDGDDTKSWFSSFGPTVNVSAPGGSGVPGPNGLLSTTFDQTSIGFYDTYFGTSMASPVAAGLVSLMLSINPELSPASVTEILEATSDNIDAQNPDYVGMLGAGRINAFQAVMAVPFEPMADFYTPVNIITPGDAILFIDMSVGIPDSWSWTFEGGDPQTSSEQFPVGIIYTEEGSFDVTVSVQNEFGSHSVTFEDYIVVTSTPSPYLQIAADTTVTCLFEIISFQDMSLYEPDSRTWEFEPSTYEFVNGTNANSQHPEVSFTSPGFYNVILTAENVNGISSHTFEDFIEIKGLSIPFFEDFESGTSETFQLEDKIKSLIRITDRAANDSDYGLHFSGARTVPGWSGSPTGTTPQQAWNNNTDFHASARVCKVDATGLGGVYLSFDLKQTYTLGNKFSWFRVLINDTIQIADIEGNLNFNPETNNSDPFVNRYFDLTDYAGTAFSITLQSACRFVEYFVEDGDNAYVDNIQILGSLVGTDDLMEISSNAISVFPNPAESTLTFIYSETLQDQVQVTLSAINGATVYNENFGKVNGQLRKTIDVSAFAPGAYVLKIQDNKQSSSQLVIIR